jgi:hypothetical protein
MLPDSNTPPASRKALSKKIRFEIFKRDSFTCQYCGAQPPGVVLEVDHVHPRAEGGGNESENLLTSCTKCNRGKGKRPLVERIVRPDADLMYLQTQQEIAELKRYQKAKRQRDKIMVDLVGLLQDHWFHISRLAWAPPDEFIRRLLSRNSPEVVEAAFTVVAPKIEHGNLTGQQWRPYMIAVCRNMTEEGGL